MKAAAKLIHSVEWNKKGMVALKATIP